jgi:hypothetical protein
VTVDEFLRRVREMLPELESGNREELRLIVSFDRKQRAPGQLVVQDTRRYPVVKPD